MDRLIPVSDQFDIKPEYKNNPIGDLLSYHNLGKYMGPEDKAKILIGMCMDNRKHLRIPDNFAYIIRTGGANLRHSEFKVSYAVSVGNVKHIALIAHNHCGMVSLNDKKSLFIEGLVKNAGWSELAAIQHFEENESVHELGNEIDFVISEAKRMRIRYPNITIAPLMFMLEDNKLYQVEE